MPCDDKPYSASCDENREPILAVIEPLFRDVRTLLEIGSGTGQHAVFFAAAMPHLIWQTSDCAAQLPGIRTWLAEAGRSNLPPPLCLDVQDTWPEAVYDAVFSANTAHIMSIEAVAALFQGLADRLKIGGCFALYGPFKMGGRHTSESNQAFDDWLKARDSRMGVRDLDELQTLADRQGLELVANHAMPVNNRTLVWRRRGL